MRVRTSLPALLTLALLLPLTAGAADEPGFKPLFNGRDLTGWKEASGKSPASLDGQKEAFKGRFRVYKGALVIDPSVKGDSYIETARTFGKDVHVRFEFKPGPKCNNDVFLRGSKFDIVSGNKEHKNVKERAWYTLDIVVAGDQMEHKVNGVTVRKSKAGAKATPLKLRAEYGAIEIKNIRVKE